MTNLPDPDEILQEAYTDGGRLYSVSSWIYKIIIIINWIIGIIGFITGFSFIFFGVIRLLTSNDHANLLISAAGIIYCLITTLTCLMIYTLAVLSTHIAKVLVNISYSNLEIAQLLNKKELPSKEIIESPEQEKIGPQKTCSNCKTKVESWAQICPRCECEKFFYKSI